MLNPYESEGSCPFLDKGKCMSTVEALEYSKGGDNQEDAQTSDLLTAKKVRVFKSPLRVPGLGHGSSRKTVEQIQYNRISHKGDAIKQALLNNRATELNNLIKKPGTPILTPAKVVRVLLLPQAENSGEMITMERFMFLMIKQPEFVYTNPYFAK